ncbi:MAG: N-linked glycosylation glycosyltransferase PglG [uncultured Sulfurovum sp.]|uniref:N-linked glycosylation glycosyltransferase PglG n=1 Tax=uncultured Sulfurovum sp. TaxID=269237 RepID=A0A6S6T5J0_9BACT|nr:MAG: N-linked glycosylation glycosyltransferase PglG [uncultured Sulfurovum sp.]
MKEFIKVYKENQEDIEKFILTTLKNNGSILTQASSNYKKVFKTFPSMELLYITDLEYIQCAPNVYRNKIEVSAKGKSRIYLSTKMMQKEEDFFISAPYLSSTTGHTCITVMRKENDRYIFIDFRLSALLGRLGLVELNPAFNTFTTFFYKAVGFSLMAFAFFAIFYAILGYLSSIFIQGDFSLDAIFKPIVALTLGLAIFDLAKTILEREVFFKNYSNESEDANVLTKFSIAIIIALSIEALMVVFKIALHDYSAMIHALYLIMGIALIIISLGIYSYLSRKKN